METARAVLFGFLTILVLMVVTSALRSAPQSTTGTVELVKIQPTIRDAEIDRSKCGEYFARVEHSKVFPPGTRVELVARIKTRDVVLELMQDKFRVIISSSAIIPTVNVTVIRGRALSFVDEPELRVPALVHRPTDVESVVVRINRQDYNASATCLPPPSREGI